MALNQKLRGFQLISQEKLQTLLHSIPNKKDLIIEPCIIHKLEHIVSASWIKSKGVAKIFKYDPETAISRQQNTQVYLINANLSTFRRVLEQIWELENKDPNSAENIETGIKNYHIVFVPNCYSFFHTVLEEEGLYGTVQLHRFTWDFILLDDDLLSMEVPQVFPDTFIKNDCSLLPSIAQSLRILNMVCGQPDLILSYGKNAEKVVDIIDQLGPPPSANTTKSSLFSTLIVIDRNKDYPSCLLTPSIYSGLLLEVFSHKCGEIDVDSNKISGQKLSIFNLDDKKAPKASSSSSSSINLNSTKDEIFGENKFKHFAQASNLVRAQAKSIGLEVQNLNKMKLTEMQDYVVKKLPKITEMKLKITKHLNVCEKIIEELAGSFQKLSNLEEEILNNSNKKKTLTEIEEILSTEGQKFNTLRLLCLVHLSMGLTSEELSNFIRNYCNYFGLKYVYIFENLAKAGLLPHIEEDNITKKIGKIAIPMFQNQTEFQAIANRFKLFPESSESSEKSAFDESVFCPSNVFNKLYIPLVAQIASILIKSTSIDELAQKLGNLDQINFHWTTDDKCVDFFESRSLKVIQAAIKKGELTDKFPLKNRTVHIHVIGGVSYAEIAACDLVSKLVGRGTKIVVSSNCIVSGSDLIASAF